MTKKMTPREKLNRYRLVDIDGNEYGRFMTMGCALTSMKELRRFRGQKLFVKVILYERKSKRKK